MTSSLGVSEPQLLARGGHSPRFSPDGKSIAYYVGERSAIARRPMRSKLFVIERATGQVQQLASQVLAASSELWSPDSKYILFSGSDVDNVDAPMDWYVAALGNGTIRKLGAIAVFSRQRLSGVIPHGWGSGDEVIFSASLGDSRNMWRIPISRISWTAGPKAERLTSGPGMESQAAIVAGIPGARIVFAALTFRINLWALPLDSGGTHPTGAATRLTDDDATVGFSDLTADGRFLVFMSNRSGTKQIWSKDLNTGNESPLTDGGDHNDPVITPDGSRLAYYSESQLTKYEITVGKGPSQLRPQRKIAVEAGMPYSWSPDGSILFFAALHGPWAVDAMNRTTGSRYTVYGNPAYDVTYFRVSPDGAWAVASVFDSGESYIQLAPLKKGGTLLPQDWISIATDAAEHDRPVWAASGNLIYYTSFRDGFRCIWAQGLDPASKHPTGAPEAVYHSHSAGLSLRNSGQSYFRIAVAPDKLVFNMGELRGNLWMATVPPHH